MNVIRTCLLAVAAELKKDPALGAELRAVLGFGSSAAEDDWIPLARAPIAKKTARRLARTGVIAAKQEAGRWYLSRASLDAYLRDTKQSPVSSGGENELRRELGLRGAA